MSTGKKSHSPDSFVPSNPLARRGYLRMVSPSEMVVAYQCPCGQLIPPQDSITHRLMCEHPAKAQGRTVTIPLPSLILVQTTRGVMVVEGMETEEDKAKFGPCPFPQANADKLVIPKHVVEKVLPTASEPTILVEKTSKSNEETLFDRHEGN